MGEVRTTKKIRVKVQAPDADNPGYHVHLPAYMMVPGSWQPLIAGRVDKDGVRVFDDAKKPVDLTPAERAQLTCEVEVPDDEVDEAGRPSAQKIRAKYKGQPRWDRDDVLSDI